MLPSIAIPFCVFIWLWLIRPSLIHYQGHSIPLSVSYTLVLIVLLPPSFVLSTPPTYPLAMLASLPVKNLVPNPPRARQAALPRPSVTCHLLQLNACLPLLYLVTNQLPLDVSSQPQRLVLFPGLLYQRLERQGRLNVKPRQPQLRP